MNALEQLMKAFGNAGGDRAILADSATAHLVADGHTILSSREIEGIEVEAQATASGISAKVRVRQGVRLKNPVHLCFGVLHTRGSQNIQMEVQLEKNAAASFIAHCIFPEAEQVLHTMDAAIDIGEGAEMRYTEIHFHGRHGGVEAIPKALVRVGKNGRYLGAFTLITGRVGRLAIDYAVQAEENGVVELLTRVFGHGSDAIVIKEKVVLAGENSRGLIKTRVAIEDEATAEITGITEGNAAGARGHVDCLEIVKDHAVASASPVVRVTNPLAKVTHEAAIGSVDKRQLETLMVHGLTPEEAVEVIVKGILR
ncbi:SufB/SufD family protein [Thiovibrio frasassiensis]|uniref:SufD family Fe-S cluster assembly protein n=1 Tax=Thiovibrio frasassiensis TaxID=2984131 RepID=A0A9X4MIH8_9BACT|nr:SufD family Fe-S cluster assembly protein [Thiovibrio frasassiensis]MDG4476981.1 SufD family Fe-S cluster assembly protein [Thiovibrio frasassiensis]